MKNEEQTTGKVFRPSVRSIAREAGRMIKHGAEKGISGCYNYFRDAGRGLRYETSKCFGGAKLSFLGNIGVAYCAPSTLRYAWDNPLNPETTGVHDFIGFVAGTIVGAAVWGGSFVALGKSMGSYGVIIPLSTNLLSAGYELGRAARKRLESQQNQKSSGLEEIAFNEKGGEKEQNDQ